EKGLLLSPRGLRVLWRFVEKQRWQKLGRLARRHQRGKLRFQRRVRAQERRSGRQKHGLMAELDRDRSSWRTCEQSGGDDRLPWKWNLGRQAGRWLGRVPADPTERGRLGARDDLHSHLVG